MSPVSFVGASRVSLSQQSELLLLWLKQLGLHFDPFSPLDAASDLRLGEYLVGHQVFSQVWGDWVSWLFAPPGGGKTALRRRTAQACWVGQETNRPFPISYIPPLLSWEHTTPSGDDHLSALSCAGAIALFLALAHRPHWLFRLDSEARQQIKDVLTWNLPGPLDGYLERCRQSESLQHLRETLDPTFTLPDPPDAPTLLSWCDALAAVPSSQAAPPPAERWEVLCDLILNTLKFRAIYVLMDGLDAAPETDTNPQAIVSILSPLIPLVSDWADRRIFFKGFLPLEVQSLLDAPSAHVATIRWDPAQLAEVIRRRVYVASEGAFGSLDAIASPALRDVETILAGAALPLPREILVLTRRVLREHVEREGSDGKIQEEDVRIAIEWYNQYRPAIEID
jgi:hypothetical protein